MKKPLLFFLVLLFIFSQFTSAQDSPTWQWSHAIPQGNSLRWIKMWDNNNWYAVGYGGTFMKTTNAGADWYITHKAGKMNTDGSSDLLYSAYFRNMDTGFTVGTGGVQTTVDGGLTFQPLAAPFPAAAVLYQAFMLNDLVGYAAGTTSVRLAKTTDGGFTWTQNTALPSGTFYDAATVNDTIIIVCGGAGNLQRSTDGGVTFTQVSTGSSATLYKAAFKDANTVYAAGGSGAIRMSTDAGATWTSINTGLPATYFYDLDLAGDDIYLTGSSEFIYKSTDNGASWTSIEFAAPFSEQPVKATSYATDFLSDRFVTVGSYGLINLKIGSNTASCLTTLKKAQTLYGVWTESTSGKVIAVGAPSDADSTFDQVMYSTNGGETWSLSTFTDSPSGVFRAVEMADDNTGYIAGVGGIIYKTTDGGLNWSPLTPPAALGGANLFDIEFVNPDTGWIFGQYGNVWKTTDGGLNWTQQTSGTGTTNAIFSACMLNANIGWLGGGGGILAYTSDGGNTWTTQNSGVTTIIYSIKAINENLVYFAGQTNIAKSTNGGNTWTLMPWPSTWSTANKIYGMDFSDEMNGAIAGQGSSAVGTAAVTTDGGITWTTYFTGASTIQGISMAKTATDTFTVYAVGNNSNIVKYSNAVIPVELTSFTADVNGNKVSLKWYTSTETNNKGFSIERKTIGRFETVSFIDGKGTTTEPQSYTYVETVKPGKYAYRLKQIDFDGTASYSNEVYVSIGQPSSFELSQNYPNPFNPTTTIRYAVPVDGLIKLAVYNVIGQKVADLVNQHVTAGEYELIFDAGKLSSGIYFYKLESGSFTIVKKMSILK